MKSNKKFLIGKDVETVKNFDFSNIEAVIFDKDGTLTCFHSMWAPWAEQLVERIEANLSMKIRDDVYSLLNYDPECRKVGPGLLAEKPMSEIKSALKDMLVRKCLLEPIEVDDRLDSAWHLSAPVVKPTCNVFDVFKSLREIGKNIVVCTSDSRTNTDISLKSLGVEGMIELSVCGDDSFNTAKPAPDNIFHICKHLGIDPKNTIVIGDTPADTKMGRRAGCGLVIGVLSGVNGADTLLTDADIVCEDIEHALQLMKS